MNRIDDSQRRKLFGLANEAWSDAGSPGEFNAWRHEQQQVFCGVESVSGCTIDEYNRMTVHYRWVIANCRPAPTPTRQVRMEGQPCEAQLRKIYALLTDMSLSWEYADGMAARMYGQKRVEQLKPSELRGLIAALTKRQQKHGGRREPAHV